MRWYNRTEEDICVVRWRILSDSIILANTESKKPRKQHKKKYKHFEKQPQTTTLRIFCIYEEVCKGLQAAMPSFVHKWQTQMVSLYMVLLLRGKG